MDELYASLLKEAHTLHDVEAETSGMDAYLGEKIKVASMDDLFNFARIGTDTLVHKAERDLWRIGEDGQGQIVIERLFDPSSNQPIRV
jgi:hypothetical protein